MYINSKYCDERTFSEPIMVMMKILSAEKTKDGKLKVYMCWDLDNASLEELASITHIRWTIEQCSKQMKRELGLDKFEGRK